MSSIHSYPFRQKPQEFLFHVPFSITTDVKNPFYQSRTLIAIEKENKRFALKNIMQSQ